MSLISAIPKPRSLPVMGKYRGLMNAFVGMGGLLVIWWLGGRAVANDPDMFAFADRTSTHNGAALGDDHIR